MPYLSWYRTYARISSASSNPRNDPIAAHPDVIAAVRFMLEFAALVNHPDPRASVHHPKKRAVQLAKPLNSDHARRAWISTLSLKDEWLNAMKHHMKSNQVPKQLMRHGMPEADAPAK